MLFVEEKNTKQNHKKTQLSYLWRVETSDDSTRTHFVSMIRILRFCCGLFRGLGWGPQRRSLMATENGTNPDPEVQNLPAEPQKSTADAGAEELPVVDVE